MPNVDSLMKETKETLAQRLASRSNGSGSSVYNPFKRDGIKIATLGQESALINAVFEKHRGAISPAEQLQAKNPAGFVPAYINNLFTWESISGKLMIGSTVLAAGGAFLRGRRKTPIKLGIFKVN